MPPCENILQQARRLGLWRDAGIVGAIGLVTALHYGTYPHAHQLHDIYRRLYYLPIILAAFHRGFAGGTIAALLVCLAYLPHALGHISHDPASPTQKALEMVLYLAVGLTTGLLTSRLHRTRRVLESTADELRASLDALRAAEGELVQSAKLAAVGRFSAGLAHEIRNPLASIRGSAELLADEFPPGHRKRRLLDVLVEESGRLNNVLTRFLAFARPRPIEAARVDIAAEVLAVMELLASRDAGRLARFTREGDCNGVAGTPTVRGDREQIRQVLLNLLLNAAEAAGDGGDVRIRWRREGGGVVVSIHDSGPGFSAEALESAFTPFFTTRKRGTGLGLAESHRIVEMHGGRITVANDPDGGALVTLDLPGDPGIAGR